MAGTVEKKLAELGIVLPTPTTPVANYIPFVRVGALLFVSGQICLDASGKLVAKGKLGDGVSVEDGQKAARACAINVLAQVKGHDSEPLVNEVVLRSQAQAEYASENYGHFGLNLRRYAHFTSPIRRYADLIVHRALIRAFGLVRPA